MQTHRDAKSRPTPEIEVIVMNAIDKKPVSTAKVTVKDLENNWPGGAQKIVSNTENHETSAPLTQTSRARVSLKDPQEKDNDESFVSSLKESS